MFQGFNEQTIDFLWGIRFNNERSWFLEHKELYQTNLHAPMKDLCEELYDYVQEKLPNQGLMCKVSRIYRDARRLHGRGPYKDYLWLSIRRPTEEKCNQPCFWFELSGDCYRYGCSLFHPKPATMMALRKDGENRPQTLEALTNALAKQDRFTFYGDEYKRPKPAPSALLAPWYSKKTLSIGYEAPLDDLLFSHDLAEQIKADMDFLIPFYLYFSAMVAAAEQ